MLVELGVVEYPGQARSAGARDKSWRQVIATAVVRPRG